VIAWKNLSLILDSCSPEGKGVEDHHVHNVILAFLSLLSQASLSVFRRFFAFCCCGAPRIIGEDFYLDIMSPFLSRPSMPLTWAWRAYMKPRSSNLLAPPLPCCDPDQYVSFQARRGPKDSLIRVAGCHPFLSPLKSRISMLNRARSRSFLPPLFVHA